MKPFGTPYSDHALRVLLLGSGELGKEVAIELQRYAVEVIAVDRYANAPAQQVAQATAFLCSPEAAYMTGSVLLVDGGASLFQFGE